MKEPNERFHVKVTRFLTRGEPELYSQRYVGQVDIKRVVE